MKGLVKRLAIYSAIMIAVVLSVVGLYDTYATNLSEKNKSYAFTLSGDSVVSIEPLSSKSVYYQVKSDVNGRVKYGITYTGDSDIVVRSWEGYDSTGYLKANDTIIVKLKLVNTSNEVKETTISTILGYENGGDLIIGDGKILISNNPIVYNTNTLLSSGVVNSPEEAFLGVLRRDQVKSITFVGDNTVPDGALGSNNVCADEGRESSIKVWYTASEVEGLYDVFIGSDNGIISLPEDSSYLFSNLINLDKINFDYVSTSNVKNLSNMFRNDHKLEYLDLSNFNTSNVQSLSGLLYDCISLKEVNLDNFDTSNVTDMSYLFYSCNSLDNIILNNFDTSNVTSMACMFYGCTNITELNLSNFDMTKVRDISNIFTNFGASKIIIDSFDFSKFTEYNNAFSKVSNDAKIVVSDCKQYELMNTLFKRTSGVRTTDGLSTECKTSDE